MKSLKSDNFASKNEKRGYLILQNDFVNSNFSLILQKLHQLHSVPLSDVGAGNLTIKDNCWYGFLNVSIHHVTDTFDDPKVQERLATYFIFKLLCNALPS